MGDGGESVLRRGDAGESVLRSGDAGERACQECEIVSI
jgi:hypothetical protein